MGRRRQIAFRVLVVAGLAVVLVAARHDAQTRMESAATGRGPAVTVAAGIDAHDAPSGGEPGRRLYVARRLGKLPRTGRPNIAGVQLPFGRRANGISVWETSRSAADAVGLASKLAGAFPRTGLWPVLWSFPDEPSSYMDGPDGESEIPGINVQRSLRTLWQRYSRQGPPFSGSFDRLARASQQHRFRNPFSIFASQEQQLDPNDRGRYRLLLIPCHRPADAIAAVGLELSGLIGDGLISAVLRSWESRFGATVVEFGAGRLVLAVNAPPRDATNASRLAREFFVLSPPTRATPDSFRQLS